MDQEDILRRAYRIEKGEDIFTLTEEDYNKNFELLSSDTVDVLASAMEMFSRHYQYNEFECDDRTDFILTVAVSSINESGNQLNDLTKNSFELLSNAIKNTTNGLSFIIVTNALEVLENNINNIDSPFFDKALISVAYISSQTPDLCRRIYQDFSISFFIDIFENFDIESNPDVPYYTLWILYYFATYKYLNNNQSLLIIEFIDNNLTNMFEQMKSQNSLKSYDYDILSNFIRILARFFKQSAIFRDTNFTINFIEIFNEIINLDTFESDNIRRLISGVLHAYIPLIIDGTAKKEPGVDIECIVSLLNPSYNIILSPALDCIRYYIPTSTQDISLLIQAGLLQHLKKIIKRGSFNSKKKCISIINNIMKLGTIDDKILLLKPKFITHLIFLAKEGSDDLYTKTLHLLDSMLELESVLDQDFQIHSTFLEIGGIQMVEEKLMYGSDTTSEISQKFLDDHFDDGDEGE